MLGLSRKNFLYNLIIWSAVSLFTATQLYLKVLQSGGSDSWTGIFKVQLIVWFIWGCITPFVYWIGARYSINRQNFFSRLLLHLPVSVVTVLFYLAIYTVVWTFSQNGSVTPESFRQIYVILFLNLFHWHFFIYVAIIGVVHANLYLETAKEHEIRSIQLEKELLISQLNFLKMQLQPHFLFNTLNSIVSSIRQSKTDTAADMTTELSDLLRISLAGTGQQITTLEKELSYVRKYLNIEKHRFKQLEIKYHIPDDLKEAEVPNFFLQPLVENAIKHGISKKSTASLIEIGASRAGDRINLTVYNDGPEVISFEEGIGLSNLKERLKAFYEDLGSFRIGAARNGTLAEITIPL